MILRLPTNWRNHGNESGGANHALARTSISGPLMAVIGPSKGWIGQLMLKCAWCTVHSHIEVIGREHPLDRTGMQGRKPYKQIVQL